MKYIFAILLFVGITQSSYSAGSYYFQRFDINSGLSQNCVNAILQDRNGFMWFGTRDGLNRYDGTSFKVFRNDFSADNGLKNNFITSLFEDAKGDIWIGTDVGLCIYHPLQERFEEFTLAAQNGARIEATVTKIGAGQDGEVLIAVSKQGLFIYNPDSGALTNYDLTKKYGNLREFAVDDGDRLWMTFYGGLYYTDGSPEELKRYIAADGSAPFGRESISKIHFAGGDKVYLGSERNGVYELNQTTDRIRKLNLNEDNNHIFVRDIISYSHNILWIGAETGLYIYNLADDGCKNLTSNFFDNYSISDNAIYSIFKDCDAGVWVGSFFGGVNYYSDRNPHFSKYYPSTRSGALTGRRIREICGAGDDTKLWVGTEDAGLFSFDMATHQFKHFAPSSNFTNIHGLCMDRDELWVATFADGVKVINTSTGAIKSYNDEDNPATIRDNYVFSIYKASNGYIYLGTANFLIRYDKGSRSFERIRELDGNLIYDIKEDSHGNLWVATYSNGLYCYQSQNRAWEHYKHTDMQGSLPSDKVLSIFEDNRRRVWITTQGGGFCRFLPESKSFDTFNSHNGLPNDVVFQIQQDEFGLFWLTTNKGLVRFDPDHGVVKVYTVADGLLEGQFNYKSSYKDKSNNIYFGTTQGMISFNHTNVEPKRSDAPIFITDFFLLNRPVLVNGMGSPLKKSITFSDKVTLKHNQNTFSLRIAALNYSNPQSEKLVYRLEGIDGDWQQLHESSLINYSMLPHGKYLLRIKKAGSEGEKVLKIDIRPPFYLSHTAYIIYVLLTCFGIYQTHLYMERRNKRRQQAMLDRFEQNKAKELYDAKISFFTNVTHEIRTPLTLIKGPLENILSKDTLADLQTKEDMRIMKQNVDRLHDLTNQLLDFRHAERANMVLNYVRCDVSHTVGDIFERFSPLAKQKGYDFTLDIDDPAFFATVDVEALTKIVSNLFTNAIKYGESYIHVSLNTSVGQDSGTFMLIVENDGEPIPDDMKDEIFKPFVRHNTSRNRDISGTGIGLALARFLAEQHGGSLSLNTEHQSNCFILSLPVVQESVFDPKPAQQNEEVDFPDAEPATTDEGKSTLLIVEDDMAVQRFVQRQLAKKYNILLADNGVQALEVLSEHIVDLVVSDIMMPMMDGVQLCSAIKSNINHCHIPVVLLTAKTMVQSKIEGAEAGADAYIEKPFSTLHLLAVIDNLIRSREMFKKSFLQYPMATLSNMTNVSKTDEEFMQRMHNVILQNIANPELKMENIAETLNMSRASFYRKIKGLLDVSPNDCLRMERLKEAARLLRSGEYQVSEVCYMVGFSSLSYFSKCFYKQYNVLPKDFS